MAGAAHSYGSGSGSGSTNDDSRRCVGGGEGGSADGAAAGGGGGGATPERRRSRCPGPGCLTLTAVLLACVGTAALAFVPRHRRSELLLAFFNVSSVGPPVDVGAGCEGIDCTRANICFTPVARASAGDRGRCSISALNRRS